MQYCERSAANLAALLSTRFYLPAVRKSCFSHQYENSGSTGVDLSRNVTPVTESVELAHIVVQTAQN
jgi:hypothetical protein